MRLFVTGLGRGAPSEHNRGRFLVPQVLDAMKCVEVVTFDCGVVQATATEWARDRKARTIHFAVHRVEPKPLDVVAWEIAQVHPDLAIGFWPGKVQRELLQHLKAKGVRVVSASGGAKSLDWHPL